MEILHGRCAGLDVHKDTVVASIRVVTTGGIERETRTFGTTTGDLLELSDWLVQNGPTPQWRRRGSTGGQSGTFWRTP